MTETQFRSDAKQGVDLGAALPETAAAAIAHAAGGRCPFHDGPETLDLLMAEVLAAGQNWERGDILDTALDLRHSMQLRRDAGQCVALLCRLRSQLDGRHYLAFYRVRCWMRRSLAVESSAGRNEPWVRHELPLDCARPDEVEHQCLAGHWPAQEDHALNAARVRFVFVKS